MNPKPDQDHSVSASGVCADSAGRKALKSLRERLGLPPPSEADVLRLRRDVDEIVKEALSQDPVMVRWAEKCRAVPSLFFKCERDVFGNCDRCDRRFP